MAEPEQVIEIRDPEIRVAEIMARIREGIPQHRAKAQIDLYHDLQQAHDNAGKIRVSLSVVGSQVPVIGRVFTSLRQKLHRLVIHYVNMLVDRQEPFNKGVVGVLSQLVYTRDDSMNRIAELEEEAAALRQRLEALERIVSTRGTENP
jgi:hypothetical protein